MNHARPATGALLSALWAISALALARLPAAAAPPHNGARVVWGEAKTVGGGAARTWVSLAADGRPLSLGIALNEAALTGLPAAHTEFVLPLPRGVDLAPFDHVGLDWNPTGHIPPGIYDRPHFDFHFYTMPLAVRNRITATGEDLARVERTPPAGHAPEGYIAAPGGAEPRMGAHWVDPASHEFHGRPFDRAFLYGFYDGRMVFAEPMVTVAYLRSHPDVSETIALPSAYPQPGLYPTSYTVRFDAGLRQYLVSLDGLTRRQ